MNVLFIGLGSIAQRHIINLRSLLGRNISISVIRSGYGKKVSEELKGLIDYFYAPGESPGFIYDAVFITNPTAFHYSALQEHLSLSNCFFIEKPVFVTGEEDISLFSISPKTYYVAAPLRYSNVIQWLKKNIDFKTVFSLRVISSSFLPDWRPGVDYRNVYSSHKDMGGGVSIDLIHEWDYISYLIGFPQSVKSIIRKKSNLEIDSDDVALYIAEYPDKVVELHLDYFGRKTQRKIELYTEDDVIVADLVQHRIIWLNTGKEVNLSEERDSYQKRELQHFIDIVSGKIESDNTIDEACRVLQIARGVE